MNDTAALLDCIERETGPTPAWAVIWLHGLGADGHDFVPLVPELVRPGWPAIRFLFPHAPVRAVTINNGTRMRAWYDIVDFDLANRADETGVLESVAQVDALIARESARGIPASRVILAGFSQGGAVALQLLRRDPHALRFVVNLSGFPFPAAMQGDTALAEVRPPALWGHGGMDPLYDPEREQAVREFMSAHTTLEEERRPQLGHAVDEIELRAVAAFLQRRAADADGR